MSEMNGTNELNEVNELIMGKQVALEDKGLLCEYLNGYDFNTSGMCFSAMYMWRVVNNFNWDIVNGYLFMDAMSQYESDAEDSHFVCPPMPPAEGFEKESLREAILAVRDRYESRGYRFKFRLVPANVRAEIEAAVPEIAWEDDRVNYDYLYSVQEIVDFKGRAFHAKKNHLNYFKNNYTYEYRRLTPAMTDEVMDFIVAFDGARDLPPAEMRTLLQEESAMRDVLLHMDEAGFVGGGIWIDDHLEAIALGGRLGSDTVVEHVEKANREIRGLYPAIINEFCRDLQRGVGLVETAGPDGLDGPDSLVSPQGSNDLVETAGPDSLDGPDSLVSPQGSNDLVETAGPGRILYLNREEDMGIENLRKAKKSYNPIRLVEKYAGQFV